MVVKLVDALQISWATLKPVGILSLISRFMFQSHILVFFSTKYFLEKRQWVWCLLLLTCKMHISLPKPGAVTHQEWWVVSNYIPKISKTKTFQTPSTWRWVWLCNPSAQAPTWLRFWFKSHTLLYKAGFSNIQNICNKGPISKAHAQSRIHYYQNTKHFCIFFFQMWCKESLSKYFFRTPEELSINTALLYNSQLSGKKKKKEK